MGRRLLFECGAELVDVDAVGADGFVELFAGDAELVGPVGDVRGHLGVDFLRVVRALAVFFVGGVGLAGFGLLGVFVFVGADLVGVGDGAASFVVLRGWMQMAG